MTPTRTLAARVDKGRIRWRDVTGAAVALSRLEGCDVDVTVQKHGTTRSSQLNRYYYGVVVAITAEYCGYTPNEMHEAWAWRFLRLEDPDHPMPTRRSTASLKTNEMMEYIERIRTAASSELACYVPDPNEYVDLEKASAA